VVSVLGSPVGPASRSSDEVARGACACLNRSILSATEPDCCCGSAILLSHHLPLTRLHPPHRHPASIHPLCGRTSPRNTRRRRTTDVYPPSHPTPPPAPLSQNIFVGTEQLPIRGHLSPHGCTNTHLYVNWTPRTILYIYVSNSASFHETLGPSSVQQHIGRRAPSLIGHHSTTTTPPATCRKD
jgi:hypothetical protein